MNISGFITRTSLSLVIKNKRRVKETLPSGRDYSITLMDGTTISRHYSDIVSALATKSNSNVTLIDPFQLIDWKEQTPPEHLYPKFKLFLDNFKDGHQTPLPAITHMGNNENKLNTQPIEVQPESCTSEPSQLDSLL